jgi:AcrR family transcriptional regulator
MTKDRFWSLVITMSAPTLIRETRDVILDAMERLLARYGYKKTTMDDVAREAGIGKGTIYLHFPSKEEVALSSIDRVVERVQDRLRALAASALSAEDRLREMLAARVLMRFDSVQAYSQGLDDLFESLRPAYMARRDRYFEAETEIFARVLAEGRRQKLFAFPDVNSTAHTLLLATNALLPYSLSPGELGERTEIEKKVARLSNLLLHGLLRRDTV